MFKGVVCLKDKHSKKRVPVYSCKPSLNTVLSERSGFKLLAGLMVAQAVETGFTIDVRC